MAFILFGDGYSVKEFFMNNIRVALTSKMYKFWGIILSIALLSFFILLIANFQEIPLYAIIFVFLTFVFALFGTILCFTHRIGVNKNKKSLVVVNLRKKEVRLEDVIDIKVNNRFSIAPKKYCYIDVVLKEDRIIKIPGYSSMIVRKNDTEKTQRIIEKIKEIIKTTNN
jgi:hypothetical protein